MSEAVTAKCYLCGGDIYQVENLQIRFCPHCDRLNPVLPPTYQEKTMKEQIKQAAIRAVRTFVQTALGVYVAGVVGAGALADFANVGLLDSAAAAGLVAVLSFIQNALEATRSVTYDRG